MLADELDYVVGVDTHRDQHAVAIVDAQTGAVIAQTTTVASARGYAEAVRFADRHAPGKRLWAVEGTGHYGAGRKRSSGDSWSVIADDSFAFEGQAQCNVTLIRHLPSLTPPSDLTRPGNDVALDGLELRLRLFHGELLVSARLLKHLPTRCDAANGAAWRHGFDIRIEDLSRRL